ncbi:MAG: hypothetical protein AAFR74_02355, partial [Pseudomonadota bacterium]
MQEARSKTIGLRTGLSILAVVIGIGVFTLFQLERLAVQTPTPTVEMPSTLSEHFSDARTLGYLKRLEEVSPAGSAALEAEAAKHIRAGADREALSRLVLMSILVELKNGAGDIKQAPFFYYDWMVQHAYMALHRLDVGQSEWCE